MKKVNIGQQKFSEWASVGIHKSRQKLYDLYYEKTYNHSPQFTDYVRNYSKIFKNVCSMAKSMSIANRIKNSNNKIKTVWNVINAETGKVKSRDTHFSLLRGDDIIHSDGDVATEFENFSLIYQWKLLSSFHHHLLRLNRY